MLRRIEGWGALALRRMDWDGAAALVRKGLCWTALAGAMFLLCRAQVTPGLAPFAMAFMAAALLAGRNAVALLAGCLAGAMNGSIRDFNLRLPVGAAIVLGGSIAWDLLEPALRQSARRGGIARLFGSGPTSDRAATQGRPAPRMQARSPNAVQALACSTLAGLGTLIPGLMGLGEAVLPDAAVAAASSVAAVAAAPFLRAGMEYRWRRRWLNPEERAGLFLLCGLVIAGLARLSPAAALCLGGAAAQLLYPGGALAGAGFGAALLAMGGGAASLALVVAGGATAQLCAGMSRPARATAACGATLALGLLLNAPLPLLAGAGLSALLTVPLPEDWAENIARLARPEPDACDPQRLAGRIRRDSARRLHALGEAFGELAEGYLRPETLPDEQALIQRLRARLCAGCGGYEACWTGERNAGARLLCDLIARAVAASGEEPLFEDAQATPELLRRCRRGRLIPERTQEPLEDFAAARRGALKRGAENRLISAQFLQARQLLESLAEQQARPLRLQTRLARRAAAALERAGADTASVTALGDGRGEIAAALASGRWTPELARASAERLSRSFGAAYVPAGPLLGRELRFVRRPRLSARTGVLCASREAGVPSGDSHLCCMLEDGKLLALICDGMGSGDEAARESALAVRLLGRFLRAGASCALAVETVNALLLNRGGEDMFATVDLLVLDLATGEARFTKLAACPTLIARRGRILRVEGGRLPLGILEQVQPGLSTARLEPGDVLLMASDGVMDAAGSAALETLLLDAPEDAREVARRAVSIAERACAGGRRDDMTAMCVRL